jgi:hypothetical protein
LSDAVRDASDASTGAGAVDQSLRSPESLDMLHTCTVARTRTRTRTTTECLVASPAMNSNATKSERCHDAQVPRA